MLEQKGGSDRVTEARSRKAGHSARCKSPGHCCRPVSAKTVGAQARSLPGSLHAQKADGSIPVSLTLRAQHSPLSSQDKDQVGVSGCSEVGPVSLEPVTTEESCVRQALSLARQLDHEVWRGDKALARGRNAGEGGILCVLTHRWHNMDWDLGLCLHI